MQAFVVQSIAFVHLLLILHKYVRPVLKKTLEERSRGIEETFRKLEQETAETSRRVAELRRMLSEVDQESRKRLQAALEEAERARKQVLAEAAQQAQATLERARREIEMEREKAVLELRQEAEALTLRTADHLVQSAMNEGIQSGMVDRTLARLETLKRS